MRGLILFLAIASIVDGFWTLLGGRTLIRSEGGWVDPSSGYSYAALSSGFVLLLIYFYLKQRESSGHVATRSDDSIDCER